MTFLPIDALTNNGKISIADNTSDLVTNLNHDWHIYHHLPTHVHSFVR